MIISSLKNQKEFDLVNKYGVKLNGRYFVLVFADNFAITSRNSYKEFSRACAKSDADIKVLSKFAPEEQILRTNDVESLKPYIVRGDLSLGATTQLPSRQEFKKNSIGAKAKNMQEKSKGSEFSETSLPAKSQKCVRLGLKVGRKVGGAVVRNKIKRRARHLFRLVSKNLQHSCAIIFIPKRNVDIVSFDLLLKDFKKLLNLHHAPDSSSGASGDIAKAF